MSFSDPEKIVEQLNLSHGSAVADLGAGSGHYALSVARTVAPGKVYAVDVRQDMLTRLQSIAQEAKLKNIEYLHGDIEVRGSTKIADSVVDCAIVANVLFQLEDKQGFIEETKRILKPGGRVLVVDWTESSLIGPTPEHVFTEAMARELFEKNSFVFIKSVSAGDHHYGLVFRT